jgi:Cu+-exporting ATPase
MPKDPVCGMELDEETAAASSEYDGDTYFFCSESCLREFEADPERYVGTWEEPRPEA